MTQVMQLVVTTRTPACPASGEGSGGSVDIEIVHDRFGLPEIPGRRVRGLLRDGLRDGWRAAEVLGLPADADLVLFGTSSSSGILRAGTARVRDVDAVQDWLRWCKVAAPDDFSQRQVLETFSMVRTQTAIDRESGSALVHALRRVRFLQRNMDLVATLEVDSDDLGYVRVVALAALHVRSIGLLRNRGYGQIKCDVFVRDTEESLTQRLRDELAQKLAQASGHES